MSWAEYDRVEYQCECGRSWKSSIARDLCIDRKHAELKRYESPVVEPAPVVVKKERKVVFTKEIRGENCIDCGVRIERKEKARGPKPKRCLICRKAKQLERAKIQQERYRQLKKEKNDGTP